MKKPSGNVFLEHLGEWVFHIFTREHLIITVPPIPFMIFMDHFAIFNSNPTQHLRWSFL